MALIGTETFPLTKQRLITALALIPNQPDVFSGSKMRESRVAFICGKNVLDSIRGWLLAANIINKDGRQYFLTDYGKRLFSNDPRMEKAGSWWSFHLSICFSERCDPYRALFYIIGENVGYIADDDVLISKLATVIIDDMASSSIKTNLDGIIKMFTGESPLSDLGFIDIVKENNKRKLCLGNARVSEQAIVHCLALARHRYFSTRMTINFSEIIESGSHHFLCLSVNDLRKRLRELSRAEKWKRYFTFLEGKDLDSIQFGDCLNPNQTILHLLQESEDTWI